MMMEASFDTEESFDDPSCLAPQPPGSVSPAKRQIKEVKETKTTVSTPRNLILESVPPSSSPICFSLTGSQASKNLSDVVCLCLTCRCVYMHCGSSWSDTGFPAY